MAGFFAGIGRAVASGASKVAETAAPKAAKGAQASTHGAESAKGGATKLSSDGVGHTPKKSETYSPEALKAANGGKKFDANAMSMQRGVRDRALQRQEKAQDKVDTLKTDINSGKFSKEEVAQKEKELASRESELEIAKKTTTAATQKLEGMTKVRSAGAIFNQHSDKVNMAVGIGSMGMMLPMLAPMFSGHGSSGAAGEAGGATTAQGSAPQVDPSMYYGSQAGLY